MDAALVDLPRSVTGSLKDKLKEYSSKVSGSTGDGIENATNCLPEIKIGTPCNNKGCRASYGPDTNPGCEFHSGYPIFHEGLKYWTCCQRKTSDFDAFLNQSGCESGKHLWTKPKESSINVDRSKTCRFDWHQTDSHVYLTVYSKLPFPEESSIRMNEIKVSLSVTFGAEKKQFETDIELYGIIDLSGSQVTFSPSKVELSLKKAEPIYWLDIERRQ